MNQLRTHPSRSASLQGIIASLGLLGPFSKGFGLKRCLNMSSTGYPEGTETQNLATTCITKIALRLCRWISETAFKVRRPQASLDMLLESTGPTEPAFGEFIMYGVKKRKTHVPQKLHSNHRELPEFPPRAKALSSAPQSRPLLSFAVPPSLKHHLIYQGCHIHTHGFPSFF